MTAECKCRPLEQNVMDGLTGKPIPACAAHGTFGSAGKDRDPARSAGAVALNSEALEQSLANALGGAVNKDAGDPFSPNLNI